jgi:DNA-binding response OmpR family regulator
MSRPKCRILCVDDHEDTSEMLKLLLSQEDYEVITALTVQDSLKLAQTEKFDLYVLDKRLPDGSGIELCQKLSTVTPDVPCMFYTGDAYDIHIKEAIAAGADCYVAKPDIDGLIEGVRKLLTERECAGALQVSTQAGK